METNKLKGLEIGSRLHDKWRGPRKLQDGTYEPKWKVTRDNMYEPIDGKARFIEDGVLEVDIANLSFEELPRDWKDINIETGIAAANIVGDKLEVTHEEMEELSSIVHEAWCDRKAREMRTFMNDLDAKGLSESEIEHRAEVKFLDDRKRMVDYNLLSEEEKQKDRNHILEATKLNREIDRGEITLEQLAKKHEKEEKSI